MYILLKWIIKGNSEYEWIPLIIMYNNYTCTLALNGRQYDFMDMWLYFLIIPMWKLPENSCIVYIETSVLTIVHIQSIMN